jgi:hypothetical protein
VLLAGGAVGWAVLSPKAATPHAQSAPAALSTSASSTSSAAATTSSAPSSTSTSPSSSAAATSSSSSAAAPSPSAAAPPATPPGYGSYTNPRFGFSTLVPANFVAQPQLSDDSSFQWADSASGAVTVRAFAENNTDGNTVDDELSSRSQGINVTWSQIKGQVLTLTGFVDDGQTIVYLREVVGQGSENLLEWTYPAKDKQQWDSAVTTTALGFRPGDVTAPH